MSAVVILVVVVVVVAILVVIFVLILVVIHLVASNPCLYSADDLAGGSRRHGLTGHLTAAAGDSAVDLGREHKSKTLQREKYQKYFDISWKERDSNIKHCKNRDCTSVYFNLWRSLK